MVDAVMLDTGTLGILVHPRMNQEVVEWVEHLALSKIPVIIPEIADYELRRNLLLESLVRSLVRLDALKEALEYAPLSTEVMLKAAALWAEARRIGRPTADLRALDGDVILAAQALQRGAVIATDNVRHLSMFAEARTWREIVIPENRGSSDQNG